MVAAEAARTGNGAGVGLDGFLGNLGLGELCAQRAPQFHEFSGLGDLDETADFGAARGVPERLEHDLDHVLLLIDCVDLGADHLAAQGLVVLEKLFEFVGGGNAKGQRVFAELFFVLRREVSRRGGRYLLP